MVVIIGKKIFNGMRTNKPAFFVERDSQRAVARSDLNGRKAVFIFVADKGDKLSAVTAMPVLGKNCQIFYLENSAPCVADDDLALHSVIVQNEHSTVFEIAFNHFALFVGDKQKIEIIFFIFGFVNFTLHLFL